MTVLFCCACWRFFWAFTIAGAGTFVRYQIRRKHDFRFPTGHGRTWVEQRVPGRTMRHISLWVGQRREDVDRYINPLLTISIDVYRNHYEERRRHAGIF